MPFAKGKSGNPSTMFQPGESGNPNGKKPGLKNWSTLVQQVLADDKIIEKLLASNGKEPPAWFKQIADKRAGNIIIMSMVVKATAGDVKCATWLRKTGYGEKLDLTSDDQPIVPLMVLDMNPPKPKPRAKRVTKPKGKASAGNKPKASRSLRDGKKPKGKKA